jgi:TonB family protein
MAAGTQSTDSVLHAVADAARVLSSADGTALALLTNGTIICRARSGRIAPELGAPLNTESGISGETLRTGTIQVCHDARTDARADTEVCRSLGIRSIVVIPLRGPRGSAAGILEAFAARPNAFDGEALHSLRALAEIAESAYRHESRGTPTSAPADTSLVATSPDPTLSAATSRAAAAAGKTSTDASTLFPSPVAAENHPADEAGAPTKRRVWVVGGISMALLVTFSVAWWSWHVPAEEISAASAANTSSSNTSIHTPTGGIALKPTPGVIVQRPDRSRAGTVLRDAAQREPVDDLPGADAPETSSPPIESAKSTSASALADVDEAPPTVSPSPSTIPEELNRLSSVAAPLPAFGPRISEGVVAPNLIHKVDPNYPFLARSQRLSGKVTLAATIGVDGSVQGVKVVSGPPLLAGAATAALRQWRYRPATLNGSPVQVEKEITFVFTLP